MIEECRAHVGVVLYTTNSRSTNGSEATDWIWTALNRLIIIIIIIIIIMRRNATGVKCNTIRSAEQGKGNRLCV